MPWLPPYWAYPTRRARAVARPRRWLPEHRKEFYLQLGSRWVFMVFQFRRGMFPYSLCTFDGKRFTEVFRFPSLESAKMKKVSIGLEPGKALPPLSHESVVLKKFPVLRFFLTGTQYEDGSPRAPGRLWLDNDGLGFRVTLFEPTAFARAVLRATTIDDVFAVCEAFLASDNPPWEADQYAREKAAGKKKK